MSGWIVICATQRCGSTLMCEDLRNAGLGRAGEFYLAGMPGRPGIEHPVFPTIAHRARGSNGVRSVKIMSSYADRVEGLLRNGRPEPASDPSQWWAIAQHHQTALWVHLSRADVLRQAASRVLSAATGVYHSVDNRSGPMDLKSAPTTAELDPGYASPGLLTAAALERELLRIAVENERWERFFSAFEIDPIRIDYGDVARSAHYLFPDLVTLAPDCPTADEITQQRTLRKLPQSTTNGFLADLIAGKEPLG